MSLFEGETDSYIREFIAGAERWIAEELNRPLLGSMPYRQHMMRCGRVNLSERMIAEAKAELLRREATFPLAAPCGADQANRAVTP